MPTDGLSLHALLTDANLGPWKSVLGALVLPPLPMLLLVGLGAQQLRRRAALGWTLLLLGCGLLWFVSTPASGHLLRAALLHPPPALSASEIVALRRSEASPPTAIVVLGAGRRELSPEYAAANLKPLTIERLRYGIWLSRQTGWPVGYAGGVGYSDDPGPTEAEVAVRVAAQEFQRPLRWTEDRSRDTRENAQLMAPILRNASIRRLVLVTHDFHQPRALRAFSAAAGRIGWAVEIVPAPVGLAAPGPLEARDFLPDGGSFRDTWIVLHEVLGLLAGA